MAVLDAFDPFPEDDFSDPGYDHEGVDGAVATPAVVASGVVASGAPALTLAEIAERIRPTVLAVEQTLEVPAPLAELFPLGGIVRGSRVSLRGAGATSLCMAMLAEASRQGSWIAVVGVAPFGWAAAVRNGWNLQRCVFVDEPPASQWGTVMAALVDALDIVVTDPAHQVGAAEARRLAARSRERGSVIVDLALDAALAGRSRSRWPIESDLTLTARTGGWSGLGVGTGLLGERELCIEAIGRRGAGRPRTIEVSVGVDGSLLRRGRADTGGVSDPAAAASARRHLRSVG